MGKNWKDKIFNPEFFNSCFRYSIYFIGTCFVHNRKVLCTRNWISHQKHLKLQMGMAGLMTDIEYLITKYCFLKDAKSLVNNSVPHLHAVEKSLPTIYTLNFWNWEQK